MKPTVLANAATSVGGGPASAHASASTNNGNPSNGINIKLNHDYAHPGGPQSYQQHQPQYADASTSAYGSPRQQPTPPQQQQQQYPQQHYQLPPHFQDIGFDPNMDLMDMDMFPRSRLGRMYQDPFANFGGTRKRTSLHDPYSIGNDDFSHYFDDDADFAGFPQFGTLGRRRAAAAAAAAAGAPGAPPVADPHEDDFFNRLPSEFRQYIPESFGHRRAPAATNPTTIPQQTAPPSGQQYYQAFTNSPPPPQAQNINVGVQQSPSKRLCDAAIQTEDSTTLPPSAHNTDEVDHVPRHGDNLNQHGLRNTVDMGVKTALENELHGPRAQSAPPPPPTAGGQQIPLNTQRAQQQQPGRAPQTQPSYVKTAYAPQQQAHTQQQKQQTPPPPQTPGGSYIRTIPIFVEGRSEPIINSHKEIPNQHQGGQQQQQQGASASASARSFTPQQQPQQQYYQQSSASPAAAAAQQQQQPQQQHRPTPLNTQQQQPQALPTDGLPPQTPHTLDSINKIQDIQRDVLELMACVEKFAGTRKDKEYVYIDEMLTRNLLKLDTIDTNGKDSIRLARKEAIKCIQASINVLEAKAEENARNAAALIAGGNSDSQVAVIENTTEKSSSKDEVTKEEAAAAAEPETLADSGAAIPLPAPEGMKTATTESQDLTNTETNTSSSVETSTTNENGDKTTTTIAVESK